MAFIDDVKKMILSFTIDTISECKDRKIAGLIDMHLISKSNNLYKKTFTICNENSKTENHINFDSLFDDSEVFVIESAEDLKVFWDKLLED